MVDNKQVSRKLRGDRRNLTDDRQIDKQIQLLDSWIEDRQQINAQMVDKWINARQSIDGQIMRVNRSVDR